MGKIHSLLSTGLPGLDSALKGVRPGDNIVWQVNSVDDYIPFVHPFCKQADRENRKLIYFRFADHQPLVPPDIPVETYELHPEDGFENFIDEIFAVIEKYSYGACYVFDSLSELAVDWYSDRMLGNFFMLTCPYLYDFDTATYFALINNRHTADAIDAIHKTAQVVIDVYKKDNALYIHPLKVYKRHSDTMYMLHSANEDGSFTPVKHSSTISEVYSSVPQPWLNFTTHRFDSWTQTFSRAQEILESEMSPQSSEEHSFIHDKIVRMAITREPRLMELARKFFSLEDLLETGKRMIGTGLIGGKSVGMLLARAILEKTDNKWKKRLESHDSFYAGSDLFYTYLIHNGCWWIRRKLKKHDNEFDNAKEARQRLLNGSFPEDIRAQFSELLNYFGQSPIIVRSSSLLEDAFGNSFSGKYESVFCANQGTPEQRLEDLLNAVRKVYASTMDPDALSYRAFWNLMDCDEQMALLIQRVSGSFYDRQFFPQTAGVGFSFNPFVWNKDIDPEKGMIRLVFGLGTRAVDRHDDDYTRVISLGAPHLRPESTLKDIRRYTQKKVDLIDLQTNSLMNNSFEQIAQRIAPEINLDLFTTVDEELQQRAQHHNTEVFSRVLTFENLIEKTSFIDDMQQILSTLQSAYDYPVDIEFTCNMDDKDQHKINIVQCRPFQVKKENAVSVDIGTIPAQQTIIKTSGPIIGNSLIGQIDRIIYIAPSTYSQLSENDRYSIARTIGKLTRLEGINAAKKIMLIGPGRWGTTCPSLGVPVSFAEISNVSIIGELACMHEGLIPDVSLGTHFFNDLVEMNMLYLAVYPEREDYYVNQSFLENKNSALTTLLPQAQMWDHIIYVIDQKACGKNLYIRSDSLNQSGLCYFQDMPSKSKARK